MSVQPNTQAENELICRLLFGWELHGDEWWGAGQLQCYVGDTPTFEDWSSAGLVLEALNRLSDVGWVLGNADPRLGVRCFSMGINGYKHAAIRDTGPRAIRAAALAYLRTLRT